MLGSSSPLGEIPREWLEEIEWRIARPLGWNSCWFISPRKRGGSDPTQQAPDFRSHPQISVMHYARGKGWQAINVRARSYIARIFYEYEFEPHFKASHERKFSEAHGGHTKIIHTNAFVSSWLIKTSCDDDRCVNPHHFVFALNASARHGGDAKMIRPGAGRALSTRKGVTPADMRRRGYYGEET